MSLKVSSLALLASLIIPSALASPNIIHNVKGYTYTTSGEFKQFSQIAFEDGKVLAIGDSLRRDYVDAKLINGQGRTLLPGFTDGHGHFVGLGFNLLNVDIRGKGSAKEAAATVARYAKLNPNLNWIKGRGWNQVLWPGKAFPTAADLDEVVADRPVVLSRVDGHAIWVNSKAMEVAGITKSTLSPKGGEIVKDAQGNPTGVFIDNAENLIRSKIPAPGKQEVRLAYDRATEHLLSLGVTSMHDAGISHDEYHLFKTLAESREARVRIYGMIAASDPYLETMLSKGYVNDANDMLSIRSVKIYGDGALGSRGAALLQAYSDDKDNVGLLVTQPKALRHLYQQILAHKFQINIHAIGDRANRLALDEFERAFNTMPKARALRHRVEHAQVISVDDIPRFKQLDVLPSMQPTHATSDKNMAQDRVGKERLKGAYAWQSFIKQGSKVIAGSDFPVELANPFYGLHAAVTRQDRNNQPDNGWLKHEALSVQQAFKAFTIDAAYGAHQEHILGGLEVGKWADFILIDKDIFEIDASLLWTPKVLQTWMSGKRLY